MLVAVASTNPVKIKAAREAFEQAFRMPVEVKGVKTTSGVGEQPLSDEETFRGARNRAMAARRAIPPADFWVGIEGGIQELDKGMEAFGWVFLIRADGTEGMARSASFFLPPVAVAGIRAGGELGPVMDRLFEVKDSKAQGGAVGLLTHTLVSRQGLYQQPVILALIPFINQGLFSG